MKWYAPFMAITLPIGGLMSLFEGKTVEASIYLCTSILISVYLFNK